MSRLKDRYNKEIRETLLKKFGYKNVNIVPKLEKVIVNSCSGDCVTNGKVVDSIVSDLTAITGQKPVIARAKKSEAGFKLRAGQAIGAAVTLRGGRMYEFFVRLINIAPPPGRDFF